MIFFRASGKICHCSLNSSRYFAANVWDIVLEEIKILKDFDEFNCHGKLCWIYLHHGSIPLEGQPLCDFCNHWNKSIFRVLNISLGLEKM